MWRSIGAALVAVAVLATPARAVEAMTPPATVPAKVSPVAQTKAKLAPKITDPNTTGPKTTGPKTTGAKTIGAKTIGARTTGAKTTGPKTTGAIPSIKTAKQHSPGKLAAKPAGDKSLAVKSSGNQISKKAGNKRKQIAAAKPSKQHAKVLTAKTRDMKTWDVKAAEPVETTGSVAPRSVPMPGLY
jgi:hypothetical protein